MTTAKETFFILKFGPNHEETFRQWVDNKIELTQEERWTLAKLIEVERDSMIELKAMMNNIEISEDCFDDHN